MLGHNTVYFSLKRFQVACLAASLRLHFAAPPPRCVAAPLPRRTPPHRQPLPRRHAATPPRCPAAPLKRKLLRPQGHMCAAPHAHAPCSCHHCRHGVNNRQWEGPRRRCQPIQHACIRHRAEAPERVRCTAATLRGLMAGCSSQKLDW
jgi:hypothetical protein